MRQLLLATVATAALALPAVAADTMQQSNSTQSQTQAQPVSQQRAEVDIQHQTLSSAEIKDIQQALIDEGYDPGAVDGMWGNLTRAAVWNFQQENGMDPSGEVDRETLAALGVQLASQNQATVDTGSSTLSSGSETTGSGSATTGSGSGIDDAKPASDNQSDK